MTNDNEGGLSTDVKTLRANLALSATVAIIGISAPIALSFILRQILDITPLQAFTAGAALCSTSLGTTFTILQTSGLFESRLGVVLTSAAMMDDVVGLVMVQMISNLGGSSSNFNAMTIVRPIVVSLAFGVSLPVVCAWVVKPLTISTSNTLRYGQLTRVQELLVSKKVGFLMHTAFLFAMVTGSSYAGTSNLFAAYLAGASTSWFDSLRQDTRYRHHGSNVYGVTSSPSNSAERAVPAHSVELKSVRSNAPAVNTAQGDTGEVEMKPQQQGDAIPDIQPPLTDIEQDAYTGASVYHSYYAATVESVLKPFFFASIGFSIPISRMFSGSIVWRGIVYAALMVLGKILCGIVLVRFTIPALGLQPLKDLLLCSNLICWPWPSSQSSVRVCKATRPGHAGRSTEQVLRPRHPQDQSYGRTTRSTALSPQTTIKNEAAETLSKSLKPRSMYPAAILGNAMVPRGEIGFLISSVAESKGLYGSRNNEGSSELFLIVTWAILLCTLLGPISVGLLVKHVRRVQKLERSKNSGREDPLGIWGVTGT